VNAQLKDEDDALLASPLPTLEQLPSPRDFIGYFDQFKSLAKKVPEESKQYWEPSSVSVVGLERLRHHLAEAIEGVELDSPWFMACRQAGGAAETTEPWRELIELIKTSRDQIGKKERLGVRPRPPPPAPPPAHAPRPA